MDKKPRRTGKAGTSTGGYEEELCLIGPNSLVEFIKFVKRRTEGGRDLAEGDIAEVWRAAARIFQGLQTTEAGAADGPQIVPFPPPVLAHMKKLMKQLHFQRAFRTVPVAFGMVEIDKMIACQFEVSGAKVKSLRKSLAADLSIARLAEICLPMAPPDAHFAVVRESSDEFIFQAGTHDFRYLGAKLLPGDALQTPTFNGFPAATIAVGLGFSTNVLNAVRYGQRLVLNNGYHRVNALRSLGVTHVPCIIQVCELWDDVIVAGMDEISNNGNLYFNSTRPPMVKDYFNPGLTVRYPTRPMTKQIQVKVASESLQLLQ